MQTSAIPIAGASQESPTGLRDRLANISILIIDGDRALRDSLARALEPRCRKVAVAADTEEATGLVGAQHFDLILLENVLSGQSGLDWLRAQRATGLDADVILISAYADLDTVVHAMRAGASDYLRKPIRMNQLLGAILGVFERRRTGRAPARNAERNDEVLAARGRLLGKSAGIETVRNTLERVAETDMPVLVLGESGTGKEIAARTLHAMSGRANKPFIAVNCAAVSAERLCNGIQGGESGEADGLLVQAAEGTVFLDEITELPERAQAALLRVLDDGCVRSGTGQREVNLNLRFVCSSNRNIKQAVEDGTLRGDLYHRISAVEVTMPPLRERSGDIPEFVALFMDGVARKTGSAPPPLSEDLLLNLARHDWPGNVRELRNLVERSAVLGAFPPEFAGGSDAAEAEPVESLQAVERQHILTVLEACGGNRAEAARRLGISRKTIDRKCALWNTESRRPGS